MEGGQTCLPSVAHWVLLLRVKQWWYPPRIGAGEGHGSGWRCRRCLKLRPGMGEDTRCCFTPTGDGLLFLSSSLEVRWVEVWTSASVTLAHTKADHGLSEPPQSKQGVKAVL